MRKALFLDRDGTINVERCYVYKSEDFTLIDGVCEAIKHYMEKDYLVIVITNQSGVGRGLYSEDDVKALHDYADKIFLTNGVKIDKWYYCPHHPIYGLNKYKISCNCRKPKTGMIEQAIQEYDIDVDHSLLVGDKIEDIECGEKMGIKSLFIDQFLNQEKDGARQGEV